MLRTFIALVLCVGLGQVAFAGKGALDGKKATGQITNPTGTYDDDLTFKNGQFTSSACKNMGFGAAPYTSEDGKTFTATTKNKKGEVMVWNGTVTEEAVEASGTHKDKAGKEDTFSYKGALAAAAAPAKTSKKK